MATCDVSPKGDPPGLARARPRRPDARAARASRQSARGRLRQRAVQPAGRVDLPRSPDAVTRCGSTVAPAWCATHRGSSLLEVAGPPSRRWLWRSTSSRSSTTARRRSCARRLWQSGDVGARCRRVPPRHRRERSSAPTTVSRNSSATTAPGYGETALRLDPALRLIALGPVPRVGLQDRRPSASSVSGGRLGPKLFPAPLGSARFDRCIRKDAPSGWT